MSASAGEILKKLSRPFLPRTRYRFHVQGQTVPMRIPSLKQADAVKTILTDEHLLSQKQYFDALGFKSGRTLVDIGANIGYVSMVYSLLFPDSEVIALEPSPSNFKLLVENSRPRRNIFPLEFGAHDRAASAELSLPSARQNPRMSERYYPNSGLLSMYGQSGQKTEKIRLMPLDDWAAAYPKRVDIGFIKIDVEGNELKALQGAQRLLSEVHPALEVEMNPRSFEMADVSFKEIRDHLAKFGYRAYLFEGGRLRRFEKDNVAEIVNMVFLHEK